MTGGAGAAGAAPLFDIGQLDTGGGGLNISIDPDVVLAVAERQGFLSPERAKALEEQVARTQADLERMRQAGPEYRPEVDAAIESYNAEDVEGAKAAFARLDALMAERRAKLLADERELRLEEARSKHAQATLFHPFEASRAEPLLTEAAELAEDNINYWIECGRARVQVGNLERALAAFEKARDLARATGNKRDYSVALDDTADVGVAQGRVDDALDAYTESLGIRRDLAARDPGNAGWAWDVVVSYAKLAQVDTANAAAHWGEVVERMEAMAAAGTLRPVDVPYLDAARENLRAAGE